MQLANIKRFLTFELYSLHYAISSLLILISAYFISSYYHFSESHWLLLAAILFSQAGLKAEQHWQYSWQVLYYLVYGLLVATIVFFITAIQPYFIASAIVIVAMVFITAYLGRLHHHLFFLALVISALSIKAAFVATNNMDQALQRAVLVLMACIIIFLFRFPLFIHQHKYRARDARLIFLQNLKKLFCYVLTPDLQVKEYENKFQKIWTSALASLRNMKLYISKEQAECWEKIWDISISLGSLRYRITDFSVLTIGQQELQIILQEILSIILNQEKNGTAIDSESLYKAIQDLEHLYQSMLQTVTKDPLALLLFIQDLYALKTAFTSLEVPGKVNPQLAPAPFCWTKPGWLFALRSTTAVIVSLTASYFIPQASFWLPLSTLLVTQIELGLPLHQMLQRVFVIMLILVITMQVFTVIPLSCSNSIMIAATTGLAYWHAYSSQRLVALPPSLLILTMVAFAGWPSINDSLPFLQDIIIGSVIGIASTLLIFADKPDAEFLSRVVLLLQAAQGYFNYLIKSFLSPSEHTATVTPRMLVEELWSNRDLTFPVWVFESGFNPKLKPGYRYFLIHLGQIAEILFALHDLARYQFDETLFTKFKDSLLKYEAANQELFASIIQFLEKKGKSISIASDFMADVIDLEKYFKANVNVSLELLDISPDYVRLAALVRYLKDLRSQLLQLGSTLRE